MNQDIVALIAEEMRDLEAMLANPRVSDIMTDGQAEGLRYWQESHPAEYAAAEESLKLISQRR